MKLVALSILASSILLSLTIHLAVKGLEGPVPHTVIAADLQAPRTVISRATVEALVLNPANQDRIKKLAKKERGFEIDPARPLWIRSTLDEKNIHIAYAITSGDSKNAWIGLSFERDDFGYYVMETDPPLVLNPMP